ncbi:MAG TPA: lysophospholipase [Anaerolineae bacterium]|nr:lysophospholipase [Anaerolineae bacterium]
MRHFEGRFNANDGLDIFYQTWLPDERPKAIFLIAHGMGEHSGRYQNYTDFFVPRGYGFYVMDLRGCGQSAGRRGHVDRFEDFLEDLRQLHDLARLAESSGKIFVLGHSFGSLIALTYGLRYPDGLAGVISSATALRDTLPYPGWVRALMRRAGRALPTLSAPSGVKAEHISTDRRVVEAYQADPLVHFVATLRWASESLAIREWLMRHAHEWTLPLLMLHGGADRICLPAGAQLFRERVRNAAVEYREYKGMYHEVHNEPGREAVFRDIEAWLEEKL